ncbi:MAG: gliding motility-associated C-terminal domain-containing protein [Candidatus Latescibacteria bacterium]|nr:gliding motility-associated C-terminal domain-containing protein [Candidatus Latescibacterota bacterium]
MSADGSNLANLTNHPARDSNPAWSPVIADTGNVATPLLGIVEVVPPVFTPNGDKVNDEISVRIRAEGVQRSWVKVYDLAGHCVRDLPMESMPPSGERRGGWDGRSDAGSLLPPGVYLICIHFVNARNQDKEIMRLVVRQLNSFTLDAALSLSAEGSEVKKLN